MCSPAPTMCFLSNMRHSEWKKYFVNKYFVNKYFVNKYFVPPHLPLSIIEHNACVEYGHCNTLQHTATHCNTLQFIWYGAHCNTLQHTATHCNTLQHIAICLIWNTLRAPAPTIPVSFPGIYVHKYAHI